MSGVVKQTAYWVEGYTQRWYDEIEPDSVPLPPIAQEAFQALWQKDFDSARCQSDSHTDEDAPGVGFALRGDRDEQTIFAPLSIIVDTDSEGVESTWRLCEDCSAVLVRKAETVGGER